MTKAPSELQERLAGQGRNRFRHRAAAVHPDLRAADAGLTMAATKKTGSVLFACTMNAVRSPMAAAMLRHLTRRDIYIESAGSRRARSIPWRWKRWRRSGMEIGKHTAPPVRGSGGRQLRPGDHPVARGPAQGGGTDPHRRHPGGILADHGPHRGGGLARAAAGGLPCRAGPADAAAETQRVLAETP